MPPAPGLRSPALWGSEAHLRALFPHAALEATRRHFRFRYRSPQHWLDVFRTYYGPTHRAFAALDADGQAGLAAALVALLEELNEGGPDSLVVPSEYLEVVVRR